MNEDSLNDLKQFIAATVSQATSDMATKDDIANMATRNDIANMATKGDIAKLSSQITDLELKVDTIAETLNDDLNDHEVRITKLEQQTTSA
ncbi:MAG: hypothetical protein ABI220_00850 [Candidatus Saccharimonadales bacterium]